MSSVSSGELSKLKLNLLLRLNEYDSISAVCGGDSVRNFATEGTPLALSNSGSHTNLSTLTVDKDEADVSSESDGDAALLDAIAQRGNRPLGGGGPKPGPAARSGRSRSSLGVREEGEGRVGVRAAAAPRGTSGPAARAATQRRGGGSHLVQHGALTRPR